MSLTLVTGATGFVGRQIVAALKEAGCSLRIVTRDENLVEGDVAHTPDLFNESPDFWRAAFDGVERVVHAAWYAEPGRYVTSPLNLTCMAGTLRMAEAAAAAGVKRFTGVGTCFEYDLTRGYLTTETPLLPRSPYGAAKAGTFMAACEIVGVYAPGWNICAVPADHKGPLELPTASPADLVMVTTNGLSNKESAWFSTEPLSQEAK